jgi:hypothetical protein
MNRIAVANAFDLSVRLMLIAGLTGIGFTLARFIGPGVHA